MRVAALTCIVAALAIGGCGGDDENDDSASSAPTPSDTSRSAAPQGSSGSSDTTAADDTATSTSTSTEQPPPADEDGISRTEYRDRADRICRQAQLDIARRSAQYRDLGKALAHGKIKRPEYLRRSGELTEQSGEIAQSAVADLKELPRPASRRDAIEAYLRATTTQAAILTEQGRALQQGRIKDLAELNRRLARVGQGTRTAARRIGFRVCGGGS
jgi:hypothetical protein